MANKTTLKGYFEIGDIPSQAQYADLIDSNLNLQETGTQILVGTLSASFLEVQNHITSSGNISASGYLVVQNITASSNISASGFLTAQNITASANISASGTGSFGFLALANISTSGYLVVQNITASSNISASGFLTAQNITASANISASGTGSFGFLALANISTSGYLVAQNITASANISASGTITATSFTGSLKGTASTASIATTVTLTATNATNAAHYLTFTDAATGNENVRTNTLLTYNPSSNTLTTGLLVATTVLATTVLATTVGASTYQYNDPESLTAGGGSQGDATPITRSGPIFVTGVTGRGILLPRWLETVYILTIHNMSLTDKFLLYPYFGESIGTLGSNVPATVPAGGSIILTSGGPNAGQWFGYLGNAIS
jgi:hypothetical protein